jgi:hypothetical protein
VKRVHDLPIDVELKLRVCLVAHTHGTGPFVAVKPAELVLHETALSPDSVHDLEVLGLTRDGAP